MTHIARYRIEGMHCAACVVRVETAIGKLPGVAAVAVNLATNEARVQHDTDAQPDIAHAVESVGYRVCELPSLATDDQTPIAAFQVRDLLRPAVPALAVVLLAYFVESVPLAPVWMLLLATLVLFMSGREFFVNATRSLRHTALDMDVLVALGAGSAYLAGVWSFLELLQSGLSHLGHSAASGQCGSDFTAAVLIVVFVRLGRTLELRARRKASDAIGHLLNLQSPTAHVLRSSGDLLAQESEVDLPVNEVVVGDVVLVRAGERVPVDGLVLAGVTEIDESSFTGEPLPVRKKPGDRVLGGSVNQSGSFRFLAERVGDEMTLRRIAALVRDAQGSKAPIARLADRVAGIFVPIVLAIAAVTLTWWLTHADVHTAISRAVAVLVVACPCALGLATPTAVMVAMGKGAELGVLFKDGAALERTASLQIALFDKTGTLTEGRPEIVEVLPWDGVSRTELLRVAATIASGSNHPLARAVVAIAKQESVSLDATPDRVHSEPGLGLKAEVRGEIVLLGSARWLTQFEIQNGDSPFQSLADRWATLGRTPLFVARGRQVLGVLAAEDRVRSTASDATLALRHLHVDTGLVSGDRLAVVKNVAHKLGITLIEAERLPSEKADVVRSLQATGRRVGMIGDGVNDAPALASADVGFAIGAGADVAIEAADVTLVGSDPRAVPHAIELARRTLTIIRQNLFFAFAYNVISIPLATGLLSEFGAIILPPSFAAAAMSASSVLVVTNSLRLRRFKPNSSS
ncbi:copper-translocating P-type ATPase [Planctomycetia bacterium]|nr:copper-translocating P-type ATPase [Planctomycetia bacterium]